MPSVPNTRHAWWKPVDGLPLSEICVGAIDRSDRDRRAGCNTFPPPPSDVALGGTLTIRVPPLPPPAPPESALSTTVGVRAGLHAAGAATRCRDRASEAGISLGALPRDLPGVQAQDAQVSGPDLIPFDRVASVSGSDPLPGPTPA